MQRIAFINCSLLLSSLGERSEARSAQALYAAIYNPYVLQTLKKKKRITEQSEIDVMTENSKQKKRRGKGKM